MDYIIASCYTFLSTLDAPYKGSLWAQNIDVVFVQPLSINRIKLLFCWSDLWWDRIGVSATIYLINCFMTHINNLFVKKHLSLIIISNKSKFSWRWMGQVFWTWARQIGQTGQYSPFHYPIQRFLQCTVNLLKPLGPISRTLRPLKKLILRVHFFPFSK